MKVFLDTMLWLHFQPIEDIAQETLGVDGPVEIVVPRVVLRELDRHKDSHRNSKTRERARRMLQLIESAAGSGEPLKNGLRVEVYQRHPEVDFDKLNLRSNYPDDLLIAAVLDYQNCHGVVCVLFTDDTGPRLTAKLLKIDARPFPEQHRLQDVDPIEKENRDLRAQLESLKRMWPKLACVWEGTGDLLTLNLVPPGKFSETALSEKLAELSAELRHNSSLIYGGSASGNILRNLGDPNSIVPSEEIDRYKRELDEYLREYGAWMRECHARAVQESLASEVQIEVVNNGTAPADDVDIALHFPDGCILHEELPEDPEEPTAPTAPRTKRELLFGKLIAPGFIRPLSSPDPGSFFPHSFSLRKTNSYEVKDHFVRIKHGHSGKLGKFFLTFPSLENAESFAVDYRITAANLPSAIEGRLHVKVTKLPVE